MNFVPETTAPDTTGPMEKIMRELWAEHTIDSSDPMARPNRIKAIMKHYVGITEVEANLIEQAHQQGAAEVFAAFGRIIDEVDDRNGLQCLAFSYLLRGLITNFDTLSNINNRIVLENMMLGSADTTPGCDCAVCKVTDFINNGLKRRDEVLVERMKG